VALAVGCSAFAVFPAGASAASQKVDKAAVLRYGDDLTRGGGVFFDPTVAVTPGPTTRQVWDLIYDDMVHKTPTGDVAPGLAAKWATPDASTVELTLQEGVKFSDGTAFNAQAVKTAWDRLLASKRPDLPPEIKAFSSVEAVNDNAVRIHLSLPIAKKVISETLASANWLAVPSPTAVASGTLNQQPVGAGPYVLKSAIPGGDVSLTKNPKYWNPKAQHLAGVDFVQLGLGAPAVSALQAGTVDMIQGFDPSAISTIQGQQGLDVTALPGDRVVDLSLCTTRGPFANKTARQALQYALDRKAINDGALNGLGAPAESALTPASPFYDKALDHMYPYSPKKAKALLKQAGVAPGTTIHGLSSGIVPNSTIAEIVQAQLKDVGLNLEVTTTQNVTTDTPRLNPDLNVVGINPTIFGLTFGPSPNAALNPCGYSNPELQAALNDANDSTKTPAQQTAAWTNFQKILLDDSPVIYTVTPPFLTAETSKVKGVEVFNSPFGPQLDTVYMVK
jgi:peptide/nickel transport system substrate-binding protein